MLWAGIETLRAVSPTETHAVYPTPVFPSLPIPRACLGLK